MEVLGNLRLIPYIFEITYQLVWYSNVNTHPLTNRYENLYIKEPRQLSSHYNLQLALKRFKISKRISTAILLQK